MSIRAGDAVHHAPSGETWLAATDEDANGTFYAAGWPCTIGRASDCTVTRSATDEQRLKMLHDCAAMWDRRDPRYSAAKWLLEQEES